VEIDEFSHAAPSSPAAGPRSSTSARRRGRHAWERFEEYDSKRRARRSSQQEREWATQGRAKVRKSGETDKHIRHFKIDQTEKLAGKAARTEKMIERLEAVDKPREPWQLRLEVASVARSGDVVARLSGATVERDDVPAGARRPPDRVRRPDRPRRPQRQRQVDPHRPRARPHRAPTRAPRRSASGVVVGEIEQVRAQLTGADTLLRAFQDATGMTVADARTLLAKFGLVGDHVERTTASLSPGERTRASLALLMANGANLLVLDEPTNHLDLPAIEQLESALDTFDGTVLLVTHDREFLDRVRTTRTVELPV
jgi:ABC-type dipeptide/oligopeptide/nickel transport system ATPase component